MNIKEIYTNYKLNNVNYIKNNLYDKDLRMFPINALKGNFEKCDEYCNPLDISDWLLSNKLYIDEKDDSGNTGLINSILLKNYSYFYMYIKMEANIETKSNKGITPILLVLDKNNYSEYMAKTLIKHGAFLNDKIEINGKESSTLSLAAENNNIDILRYLLHHGAKISEQIDVLNQDEYSDEINNLLELFNNDLYELTINWYEKYNPTTMPNLLEFFENVKKRDLTKLELQIFGELGELIKEKGNYYEAEIYSFIRDKEIEFFKKYLSDRYTSIKDLPLFITQEESLFLNIITAVDSYEYSIRKKQITFDEENKVKEYTYDLIIGDNLKIKHTIKSEDFNNCKNAIFMLLCRCEIDYNQIPFDYTREELFLNYEELLGTFVFFKNENILEDDDMYLLFDCNSRYINFFDEKETVFKKYLYFCLRKIPDFIKKLSLYYRGNMDVFLFIARHSTYGEALQFATEKLKKNEEYRKELKNIHESFLYFTETRDDKKEKFIRLQQQKEEEKENDYEKLKQDASYYKKLSLKYPQSKKFALLAIKGDASNFQYLSSRFRNSLDFMNEARLLNPEIDKYLDIQENSNLDIEIKNKIIETIRDYNKKNYSLSIMIRTRFAKYNDYPSTIMEIVEDGNEQLVIDLFGDLGRYIAKYHKEFDDDILFEIYKADICHNPESRTLIPPEKSYLAAKLLNDKDVIKEIMEINGRELDRYRKEFREDKEIVLAAVSSNWHATKYTSKELQNDKDVIIKALQTKFRDSSIYIGKSLENDKDVLELIDKLSKKEKKQITWI